MEFHQLAHIQHQDIFELHQKVQNHHYFQDFQIESDQQYH